MVTTTLHALNDSASVFTIRTYGENDKIKYAGKVEIKEKRTARRIYYWLHVMCISYARGATTHVQFASRSTYWAVCGAARMYGRPLQHHVLLDKTWLVMTPRLFFLKKDWAPIVIQCVSCFIFPTYKKHSVWGRIRTRNKVVVQSIFNPIQYEQQHRPSSFWK